MKNLFQKHRIKLEEMLQDIFDYTKEVYKQTNSVFTVASPWGQIMNGLAKLSQFMMYYVEDSVTELNINTASRPQSIQGLARIAGHDPLRAIAATGDVSALYNGSVSNLEGDSIIIPNFSKLICKDNQLPYLVVLGRDNIKYNVVSDKNRLVFRVIQGELENQTFTGTGNSGQKFEVNMSGGQKIDNFFINVFVNGEKWKKYDSLYDIPKDSNGYLVKNGITSGIDIYFGNSYFGKIPDLGSTIVVEYLITAGAAGNIRQTDGILFEFQDSGFDDFGNEIDLNSFFTLIVSSPITFGSDTEPAALTRLLAPVTSRSFVLANTGNYIAFFEKFQYFSYINAYTEYDETNWFIDNIIYLVLVPDINKKMKPGENYFTVPYDYFFLTDMEKYKIQRLLEESGQKIVNAVVRFIDPQFKLYSININITVWSGHNKDNIRNDIIKKVSDYLSSFKRQDYLPKSDLIAILEGIEGIDSVSIYFISEDIEREFSVITNLNTISQRLSLTTVEIEAAKTYFKDNNLDTTDKRLAYLTTLTSVKEFMKKYIDENGDMVFDNKSRPLVRGGWKDRYDVVYYDELNKNRLGPININIIKETQKNLNTTYNKLNVSKIKNK